MQRLPCATAYSPRADKVEIPENIDYSYEFDNGTYNKRIYHGYGHPQPEHQLKYGPNISDWPKFYPMSENMVLEVAASIYDPVTTTDELIPVGRHVVLPLQPRAACGLCTLAQGALVCAQG